MRIGLQLPRPDVVGWHQCSTAASSADELGIDLLYIAATDAVDALQAAAALSAVTQYARIAAEVAVSEHHPIHLAERAAVVDQLLCGRLILVLRDDDSGLLSEAAELVAKATMARPFSHQGPTWTVPSLLSGQSVTDELLRVTPPPAQLVLPLWLAGTGALQAGCETGCLVLADTDASPQALRESWAVLEKALGPVARLRLNRPAVRPLIMTSNDEVDVAATIDAVRTNRDVWGMDVAVLAAEGTRWSDEWPSSIAVHLRPRVQLSVLPEGIEDFWDMTLQTSQATDLPAPFSKG